MISRSYLARKGGEGHHRGREKYLRRDRKGEGGGGKR